MTTLKYILTNGYIYYVFIMIYIIIYYICGKKLSYNIYGDILCTTSSHFTIY